MSLCIIENLVVKISTRERVPLMDKSIIDTFTVFYQSFSGKSHPGDIFADVPTCHSEYRLFGLSPLISNAGMITCETIS